VIINGTDDGNMLKNRIALVTSQPGRARLALAMKSSEQIVAGLWTINGTLCREWSLFVPAGEHTMDIGAGGQQMYICTIRGKTVQYSFLMAGTSSSAASCNISGGTGMVKTAPGFQFEPGDTVKFTAFRNGMYRNSKTWIPVNGTQIHILLSAPCNGTPFVVDYDGNVYPTVEILNRCWTRENMRSTHYADGTPLVDGTGAGNIAYDFDTKYYFNYLDDADNAAVYGRLYTLTAATNAMYTTITRGICPYGWHLSTCDEWCELEQYLDPSIAYCNTGYAGEAGNYGYKVRDKMIETGTDHWDFNGYFNPSSNETGFSARPSGRRTDDGMYWGLCRNAYWWASWPAETGGDKYLCPVRAFNYLDMGVTRYCFLGDRANAVRCVKDD
jgi:uncharacterized protein (TIGR02145 family)